MKPCFHPTARSRYFPASLLNRGKHCALPSLTWAKFRLKFGQIKSLKAIYEEVELGRTVGVDAGVDSDGEVKEWISCCMQHNMSIVATLLRKIW